MSNKSRIQNIYWKNSRIRETKWRFYTLYEQKYLNLRPLLSISFPQGFRKYKKFEHLTSESECKKTLNGLNKWRKKSVKNFFRRGDFRPFLSKTVQIWDPFFPLLFPKDSKSLKLLDIQLREKGAKKRLNDTIKILTWLT